MSATTSNMQTGLNDVNVWSQQNPANSLNFTPQYGDANQLAQVSPATVQGAQLGQANTLDPRIVAAITQGNTPNLSANSTIQQLLQAFAPQQRQAQAGLNDQLAAGGLSGGPAVAAQNNLNSQLTQALAPTLASAIQQSQSNQLQSGQFNSSQLIQALTGNMNALNANQQNQAAFNQQASLANQDAFNTANTANVGARNSLYASNLSSANAAQQAQINAILQAYQNQFSAENSVIDAGLGAQNNISSSYANNFGTPTSASDAYAGLGSALGSLYSPTAKSTPALTGTATA